MRCVRRRALLVTLLVLAGPAAGRAGAASASPLQVTGFQSEGSPTALIDRSAAALSAVGIDGVDLDLYGDAVAPPGDAALRQLRDAHADRLRAQLLFGNYDTAIGDFSEPLAHRLLTTPEITRRVVGELAGDVMRQGWDGLSVDLESLRPRDRSGLTRFVRALRRALPPSASLSVDVANDVTAAGFRAGGYDLPALGAAARLILMAYDQHGPWENAPGPVGALAWTRRGLRTLLAAVGADRVDLGVAGYGYAWRPHRNLQLSDAGARALVARAGGRARWVPSAGEWTAHLDDGSTVWWSDGRSYAVRARLAARLRLHGLAVWSLGLADPLTPAESARGSLRPRHPR
jgi:spore germination protein